MKIKENIAISDTGFVFNPITGDSFTLNKTAHKIIKLIKEGKSFEEITNILRQTYDVDDITLERYLFDFISDLRNHKLLDD